MLEVLRTVKSYFKTVHLDNQNREVAGDVHSVVRRYDGWPDSQNDLFGKNFQFFCSLCQDVPVDFLGDQCDKCLDGN